MAAAAAVGESIVLRNGNKMPMFGLGTWLSDPENCVTAVKHALKNGYKLIDTAAMYANEESVGKGIRESGVPRDEIFVVTKVGEGRHGKKEIRNSLLESLSKLQLDYVDLFLIHTPKFGKVVESWREMLALRDEGLAKSVGVSNFGSQHIVGLQDEGLELPEVNQIEVSVYYQQKEFHQYAKENNVALMGYCPLARCKRFGTGGAVQDIANAHGVSEGQVLIRWSYQAGVITIPKSNNPNRIEENAAAITKFKLSGEEMEKLAQCDEGFHASSAVLSMNLPWEEVK